MCTDFSDLLSLSSANALGHFCDLIIPSLSNQHSVLSEVLIAAVNQCLTGAKPHLFEYTQVMLVGDSQQPTLWLSQWAELWESHQQPLPLSQSLHIFLQLIHTVVQLICVFLQGLFLILELQTQVLMGKKYRSIYYLVKTCLLWVLLWVKCI